MESQWCEVIGSTKHHIWSMFVKILEPILSPPKSSCQFIGNIGERGKLVYTSWGSNQSHAECGTFDSTY